MEKFAVQDDMIDNLKNVEKNTVKEALAAYCIDDSDGSEKKPGEYTLEDYYALPDEQRVELIDGAFYDMASPSSIHQLISGKIFKCFDDYIEQNRGDCIALYAPLDVQLDCDDKTMVQPDVMIVCDREKLKEHAVYGAPDLVIEVLSKSTRKKDCCKKLEKYVEAGVREYWMVDPDKKKVVVYTMDEEEWVTIYGFDDIVPVGIFNGKCKVDFAQIEKSVRFLYEKI